VGEGFWAAVSRAGFVILAGRPNVGKSTLINAIVGVKVAIVSDRPQTTRRAIRGVHTGPDTQLVLVDLPGVQRPRDTLTERMAATVKSEISGSDVALLMLNGEQGVGPGDRFIAQTLKVTKLPVIAALNKIDRLSRGAIAKALSEVSELEVAQEIFPISARTGEGVSELTGHLESLMPEGPFMFAPDEHSDQSLMVLLGELVREAVIRRTFHEVPHAVEVVVEELERTRSDLFRVRALIWVESSSQKGILIGAHGAMIKAIGIAARRELERELQCQVHLDLSVRVRRGWRADDGLLDRLGIT
jgi:GTP-binding protein Era